MRTLTSMILMTLLGIALFACTNPEIVTSIESENNNKNSPESSTFDEGEDWEAKFGDKIIISSALDNSFPYELDSILKLGEGSGLKGYLRDPNDSVFLSLADEEYLYLVLTRNSPDFFQPKLLKILRYSINEKAFTTLLTLPDEPNVLFHQLMIAKQKLIMSYSFENDLNDGLIYVRYGVIDKTGLSEFARTVHENLFFITGPPFTINQELYFATNEFDENNQISVATIKHIQVDDQVVTLENAPQYSPLEEQFVGATWVLYNVSAHNDLVYGILYDSEKPYLTLNQNRIELSSNQTIKPVNVGILADLIFVQYRDLNKPQSMGYFEAYNLNGELVDRYVISEFLADFKSIDATRLGVTLNEPFAQDLAIKPTGYLAFTDGQLTLYELPDIFYRRAGIRTLDDGFTVGVSISSPEDMIYIFRNKKTKGK